MKHIHFEECPSTQSYLLDNIGSLGQEHKEILITTDFQGQGVGRNGKVWDHLGSSLALSFTLSPSPVVTMTPLEIGVLIANFLHEKFGEEFKLKWPNDLLNIEGEKCGGILTQLTEKSVVVAGVGLNFGSVAPIEGHEYKTAPAAICDASLNSDDRKLICQELYSYILDNRLSTEELVTNWNSLCFHIDKKVRIENEHETSEGIFLGIGEIGQAKIRLDSGKEVEVVAGSLYC